MTIIKLVDARRGLNLKCRELFKSERIAEEIYRYLCDGIEECEDVEPERKRGRWEMKTDPYGFFDEVPVCSECGRITKWREKYPYCPSCGADMREGKKE